MHKLEDKNIMKSMMKTDYNDEKLNKSDELNDTMTIKNTSPDEYTRKIKNIGGSNNG